MVAAVDTLGSDDDNQILDAIGSWLEGQTTGKRVRAGDIYPEEIVKEMKELGLFSLMYPVEYGGLGMNASSYAKVITKLSETWMSLAGIINTHMMLGQLVGRFGTDSQRQFMHKLAAAELHGVLCLTEPDAGTDLQGIKTHAKAQSDHYTLNGSKMWITNGLHGSLYAVLTKTDLNASPAHKGMTMFLAERGEGFNVDGKIRKLGYRGLESVALSFDDFKISADRILGGEEGFGFKHAVGGLELGRINVAARGRGGQQQWMTLFPTHNRKTFGKPICDHQSIQIKLADMATKVEAARY